MKRFFFPDLGISVEADSRKAARAKAEKATPKEETGNKRSPSKA